MIGYMERRMLFLSKFWVEKEQFCVIRLETSVGGNYAYWLVSPGSELAELPDFIDTEDASFLGWYYADTDELVNPKKQVFEDMVIYAKWSNRPKNKWGGLMKAIPTCVIVVLFVVLAVENVRRMVRDDVGNGKRRTDYISPRD
jgi:hypothetical protein